MSGTDARTRCGGRNTREMTTSPASSLMKDTSPHGISYRISPAERLSVGRPISPGDAGTSSYGLVRE